MFHVVAITNPTFKIQKYKIINKSEDYDICDIESTLVPVDEDDVGQRTIKYIAKYTAEDERVALMAHITHNVNQSTPNRNESCCMFTKLYFTMLYYHNIENMQLYLIESESESESDICEFVSTCNFSNICDSFIDIKHLVTPMTNSEFELVAVEG